MGCLRLQNYKNEITDTKKLSNRQKSRIKR